MDDRDEAIDILTRMATNHFYGHREQEAFKLGAKALSAERRIAVIDDIPKAERDKRNEKCNKCETRKWYAKQLDFHFDWWDCPYDCTNDLEHLICEEECMDDD